MTVRTFQSWKEISQYLGRGVRTVQRWEAMFGLPVHRPAGRNRSAVFALEHEIDTWLESVGRKLNGHDDALNMSAEALFTRLQKLEAECERLRQQLAEMGAEITHPLSAHGGVRTETATVSPGLQRKIAS